MQKNRTVRRVKKIIWFCSTRARLLPEAWHIFLFSCSIFSFSNLWKSHCMWRRDMLSCRYYTFCLVWQKGATIFSLRRQGGLRGKKNMLILFERFHRCGGNAFYGLSEFYSAQKLLAFQCIGPLAFL